jgi:Pyruvate/2-oxoacid:ferredoxin oxidoreductase gamma subunit
MRPGQPRFLGKNIVNTIILGAFAKESGLVSLDSLKKAITEKFRDKGAAIIEKNINAITKAYER